MLKILLIFLSKKKIKHKIASKNDYYKNKYALHTNITKVIMF